MAFEVGHKKIGGRKKGSLNLNRTLANNLLSIHEIDPLNVILQHLPNLDPYKQVDVCLELMKYKYPKLKAIAQINLNSEISQMTDEELMKIISEFKPT